MVINLRKPIFWKDKEVKELDLQLANLKPDDLIEAEDEIIREKKVIVVMDASREYCITLAARALKLPTEVLKQMDVRDFRKIVTEVQNFLYDTDSEEKTEAETPATNPEISSEE